MKIGEYETRFSNKYPLNIELTRKGQRIGYYTDVETLFNAIISDRVVRGVGSEKGTEISLGKIIGGLRNELISATLGEFQEELKPLRKSYGNLYNLCTDYYAGDCSIKQFRKELRPLLGITKLEAEGLERTRRFAS